MFKKLARLFAISSFSTGYDNGHLHNENNHRWTAPRNASSKMLQILNDDTGFKRHLQSFGNSMVLIRIAAVGSEVRVCTYRCYTDHPTPTPIFAEGWEQTGISSYLFDGKSAELLIRNSYPHLNYDRAEPEQCFTYPLTGDELAEMMPNWIPQAA